MVFVPIDAEARPAHVHLTVADLERSLRFYRDLLGLRVLDRHDGAVALAARGSSRPHVLLVERPGARPQPRGTRGLYHFALLLPSRRDLARALLRLVEAGWPLQGASDHRVSEALYLADPDGHGIELYADRPRSQWPRRDGELAMATLALDIDGLVSEVGEEGGPVTGLPEGATMGHFHLHVADLDRATAFYHDVLGFDVMARYGDSAVFLAAGGYHHHLGLNVWAGRGAPPPPPDAAQLVGLAFAVPPAEVARLAGRLADAGCVVQEFVEEAGSGLATRDPDGNRVELVMGG